MRFSVIGHGASAEGAGLGPVIDQDQVIRLHDSAWQDQADYGTRTDWIVLPGPWFDRARPDRTPARGWLVYKLANQRRNISIPALMEGLPVLVFEREIAEVFAGLAPYRPTRGGCAIVLAGVMGARAVRPVGFDSVLAGQREPHAELAPEGRIDPSLLGATANDSHHWGRERFALLAWCAMKGITLL